MNAMSRKKQLPRYKPSIIFAPWRYNIAHLIMERQLSLLKRSFKATT
jgi:hypothetical protein